MTPASPIAARLTRAVVALAAVALALSGCSFDVYQLPLPGGPDVGSHPITVTARFRDVLDLVPDSTVKVDDVTVGKITDISLQGYTAVVTMQLRNDTHLPDDAVATIQQTSLLGEKFVQLAAPPGEQSSNPLTTGDTIPLSRTGQNPEVEEVLGALSLLLNGGGVGQLETITHELNRTLHGREGAATSVLHRVRTFSAQLDSHRGQIVRALQALDRLSGSLNRQRSTIDATLGELPGALRSISSQRHDLVRMLKALAHLSGVGTHVIALSKDSTIQTLRQLSPVLSRLQASGSDFVNAFQVALTYPFVDQVVGRDPQVARNLQMGDYTNLDIKLDLSLDDQGSLPLPSGLPLAADPAHAAADQPADLGDHPDPRRHREVPEERRHHQPGLPEGAGRPPGAAPAGRQVPAGEAPLQPGLPGARLPAQPADRRHGPAEHHPRPERPALAAPARRPRPAGVRPAGAHDAAAVTDL